MFGAVSVQGFLHASHGRPVLYDLALADRVIVFADASVLLEDALLFRRVAHFSTPRAFRMATGSGRMNTTATAPAASDAFEENPRFTRASIVEVPTHPTSAAAAKMHPSVTTQAL